MEKQQIKEILRLHKMWLENEVGGAKADLRFADLRGTKLRVANLRGADLEGADLRDVDLQGADLQGADLRGADLRGADLEGAKLRYAKLRGADLRGADLRGADLRGADLRGADLEGAKLRYADLRYANGIRFFSKDGGRQCFAVETKETLMIQAGCFWGTLDEFEAACKSKYPNDAVEAYEKQIQKLREIWEELS